MACFVVPAAEAIIVTTAEYIIKHQEKKQMKLQLEKGVQEPVLSKKSPITWSRRLHWLSCMLWGGVALLCYEHIWHGEVRAFWPFLTAASDRSAEGYAEMLHEMATVGVTMAVLVTALWGVIALLVEFVFKREDKELKEISHQTN